VAALITTVTIGNIGGVAQWLGRRSLAGGLSRT